PFSSGKARYNKFHFDVDSRPQSVCNHIVKHAKPNLYQSINYQWLCGDMGLRPLSQKDKFKHAGNKK
ncbi:MAG: hypothetical protein ACKODM_02835, partial [Cytophagales bacterium]